MIDKSGYRRGMFLTSDGPGRADYVRRARPLTRPVPETGDPSIHEDAIERLTKERVELAARLQRLQAFVDAIRGKKSA